MFTAFSYNFQSCIRARIVKAVIIHSFLSTCVRILMALQAEKNAQLATANAVLKEQNEMLMREKVLQQRQDEKRGETALYPGRM